MTTTHHHTLSYMHSSTTSPRTGTNVSRCYGTCLNCELPIYADLANGESLASAHPTFRLDVERMESAARLRTLDTSKLDTHVAVELLTHMTCWCGDDASQLSAVDPYIAGRALVLTFYSAPFAAVCDEHIGESGMSIASVLPDITAELLDELSDDEMARLNELGVEPAPVSAESDDSDDEVAEIVALLDEPVSNPLADSQPSYLAHIAMWEGAVAAGVTVSGQHPADESLWNLVDDVELRAAQAAERSSRHQTSCHFARVLRDVPACTCDSKPVGTRASAEGAGHLLGTLARVGLMTSDQIRSGLDAMTFEYAPNAWAALAESYREQLAQ